ncbi:hypothetical protein EVAR_103593_1 [Eumeta japonica]|uniref:Uncharacterized protein n=1 Tax=Eumeta variegata TaxID=151549 RepID=A0A4C1ZCH1_EUMVA|nr:hypothetical protein EVAR_103593_1 [Eumeta japonica]
MLEWRLRRKPLRDNADDDLSESSPSLVTAPGCCDSGDYNCKIKFAWNNRSLRFAYGLQKRLRFDPNMRGAALFSAVPH